MERILRATFDDPVRANEAANRLRQQGLRNIQVRNEGRPGARPDAPAGKRGTARVVLFGALVGAMLGAVLGLMIGLPSLAMPEVSQSRGSIGLMIGLLVGGPALVGAAVCGAAAALIMQANGGHSAAGGRARVLVDVPVADVAAAEEADRLLREMSATVIESETRPAA